MKKIFNIVLVVVMLVSLFGCTPPLWFIEDANVDTGDKQVLSFSHLWQRGDVNYTKIQKIISDFNESEIANELNVFVKGNGINFWDYWTKVDNQISGGNSPDIYLHTLATVKHREKNLLDLNLMYQYDLDNDIDSFDATKYFLENQLENAQVEDKLLAWPASSTVRVIYYNKDLFNEANITELPTTIDELNEISKLLTKYEDSSKSKLTQIGFDPFGAESQYPHQWGWIGGTDFWSFDEFGKATPNFNSPEILNIYKKLSNFENRLDRDRLTDFYSEYAVNGRDVFIIGRQAMVVQNEGFYQTLKTANVDFEYGVFPIPAFNEGDELVNWSSSYSMELFNNSNKYSDKVAEQRNRGSWEFLKYFNSKEVQKQVYDMSLFLIPNTVYFQEFAKDDEVFLSLAQQIQNSREAIYIKEAPKWTSDFQSSMQNYYNESKTLEEALKDAQNSIQSKIDLYYQTQGGKK